MNLIELFDSLSNPSQGNDRQYNATRIPDYPNFRVAIDAEGNPVLLLSIAKIEKNASLKNFRLKYLQLVQNVKCKITENNQTNFQEFTVITFISSDRHLQQYFLRVSETLIKSLSTNPTQQQVVETLNKFVEIFRSLSDAPRKTAQGLWAELFLIDDCANPEALLSYWHNFPEDKFDFDSGAEKIEVKSNSTCNRIHYFSSEQLNPSKGAKVLIASIFVQQCSWGTDIQELVDSITAKIQENTNLINKLNTLVCHTLGSSFEQSIKIKFDYQIAKDSLRLYEYQAIPKIEEMHIPEEVSEVKYKSDLSQIPSIDIAGLQSKDILFSSI
jgi:hypothetical protein